ncbi:glycosyltransferase family 4 protein [Uliginosibacterium sediminicola]|uniref:Glycosyltransferase family 4 protein n=1 Tax=Uliginosibacterium sediminicola TaxID=2024550 RepID=A0ABU9YVL7_9RHOO
MAQDAASDSTRQPGATGQRRRILIIHQNFPGQFRHIALHLQQSGAEVVGLGRETAPGLSNFNWFRYTLHREVKADTHPYLRQMDAAVLHGQAVVRAFGELKRKGFEPDTILAHPGWGETLYAKDVFPHARLIHFCEWYYSSEGADFGFDPEFPTTLDDALRIRTWNALHLLNLENCDAAIAPTHWQKSRFPAAYQDKICVVHEGIALDGLAPDPQAVLRIAPRSLPSSLPLVGEGLGERAIVEGGASAPGEGPALESAQHQLSFHAGQPLITFVSRNLEPYRGFHRFMRALPAVLRQHPSAQVLILGGDEVSYGSRPKDAANWREKLLRELTHPSPVTGEGQGERATDSIADQNTNTLSPEHLNRIHFLGKLPYASYKKLLQVSAVHVYLSYPFVLSWSLLEAMASGCRIIASDTAPVREVIRHNENGTLCDFFDSAQLAKQILNALADPQAGEPLRAQARLDAQAYSLARGLAGYEDVLRMVKNRKEVSGEGWSS